MEAWEYLHGKVARPGYVTLDGTEEEVSFNELGQQGWELMPPGGTIAYFKRRVEVLPGGNLEVHTEGFSPGNSPEDILYQLELSAGPPPEPKSKRPTSAKATPTK